MSTRPPAKVPRAERIQINKDFDSVEAFINEYVVNISRSGVFIKSKDPLPIGTKVNLKFSVIMEELEVIEGVGKVVRVNQRPPGMGVVFTKLTDHSKDLIVKLLTLQAQRAEARSKEGSSSTRRPPPKNIRP